MGRRRGTRQNPAPLPNGFPGREASTSTMTSLLPSRRRFRIFPVSVLILLPPLFFRLADCSQALPGDTLQICIVHTNDLHGHLLPEPVPGGAGRTGGYAVFADWVKKVREENRARGIPTLLLDAGDTFIGAPEANLTGGMAVVDLMNAVGYDAMAVGNHEIELGLDRLARLARKASFPLLAANLLSDDSREIPDCLRPSVVKEIDGFRIGILGLARTRARGLPPPGICVQPLDKKEAQRYCDLLRAQGAAMIVVLSHLGTSKDIALAYAVPDISVILGGHDHSLHPEPLVKGKDRTLICQAGSYGRYAGRLDLVIDRKQGKILRSSYQVFTNRAEPSPENPAAAGSPDRISREIAEKGHTRIGLSLPDVVGGDAGESLLGDIMTDAMRGKIGAQVAFYDDHYARALVASGQRSDDGGAGALQLDDRIVTMTLTGGQIERILEASFSSEEGMLQASGLTARYDLDRPRGSRLVQLEIGGKAAETATGYSVAVSSSLADGEGSFPLFQQGAAVTRTGISLRGALQDYFSTHSIFYPSRYAPSRLRPGKEERSIP